MDAVIQQIAQEYKSALQEIYGDDLAELILFGSFARGEQHEESVMLILPWYYGIRKQDRLPKYSKQHLLLRNFL